jgi:GTP pyrophosphokinase
MVNQDKTLDQIYDLFAVRIIVETVKDCYAALGVIHEMYTPIPGRFKDYIAMPKANMYQSLHTTLIGPSGKPFEIQIRTFEMHRVAEFGIAAHWKYKEASDGKTPGPEQEEEKLNWLRQILEWQQDMSDNREFMSLLKSDLDLFAESVYCFTPAGDVKNLPNGSTPIDFAYSIHSAVGNKMVGARVNGKLVNIDYVIQNGDRIEIITSQNSKGPSRDWLNIVKTSEARNKIRQWFKKEKRAENIVVGKSLVDKEIARFRGNISEDEKKEIVASVGKRFGMMEADDLYNALGYGGVTVSKVEPKLRAEYEKLYNEKHKDDTPVVIEPTITTTNNRKRKSTGGVLIDGEDGCAVKFAKCCNPLPGENIIGFITKGYGISIHKADCPNIKNAYSHEENANRFVKAEWDIPTSGSYKTAYDSAIQILVTNRMSLLAEISMALAEMKVDIVSINTKNIEDTTLINMTISCKDIGHFNAILSRLRGIKDVIRVTRVVSASK